MFYGTQNQTTQQSVQHTHTHTSKSRFRTPLAIGIYLLVGLSIIIGCSEIIKPNFDTNQEKSQHKYWKQADNIAKEWTNDLEYFSTHVNPFAFKSDRKKEIEKVLIFKAQSAIKDPNELNTEIADIKERIASLKPCTAEEYKTHLTNRLTAIANSLNPQQTHHLENMLLWLNGTDSSNNLQEIISHLERDESKAMQDLSLEESKTVLLISRMLIRGISYFAENRDKWEAIFNGQVLPTQMGFVPVFLAKVIRAVVIVAAVVTGAVVGLVAGGPVGAVAGAMIMGGVTTAIYSRDRCTRNANPRENCDATSAKDGALGALTFGLHGIFMD